MNKCANCEAVALYEYTVSDGFSIKYCQNHIPKFLVKEGYSRVHVIPEISEDNVEPLKKSKKLRVEEQAVAEEPVVEEPAPLED